MSIWDDQGRAKRSLGQNFLVDRAIIERIVASLGKIDGEQILEIGPGRGALTTVLLEAGSLLTAVEIDRELVPRLNRDFGERENFRCVEADVLQVDLATLIPDPPAKLVGNLPYYISTAILQKLIEQRHLFAQTVLMLQREVVERIVARPGDSSRGYLTVLVEEAFDSASLFDVPPTAFAPSPKVWSSVISLTPKVPTISDQKGFRRLLSSSFAQKRKTILNNLKSVYADADIILSSAGIDARRRAETLTLAEWTALSNEIGRPN